MTTYSEKIFNMYIFNLQENLNQWIKNMFKFGDYFAGDVRDELYRYRDYKNLDFLEWDINLPGYKSGFKSYGFMNPIVTLSELKLLTDGKKY